MATENSKPAVLQYKNISRHVTVFYDRTFKIWSVIPGRGLWCFQSSWRHDRVSNSNARRYCFSGRPVLDIEEWRSFPSVRVARKDDGRSVVLGCWCLWKTKKIEEFLLASVVTFIMEEGGGGKLKNEPITAGQKQSVDSLLKEESRKTRRRTLEARERTNRELYSSMMAVLGIEPSAERRHISSAHQRSWERVKILYPPFHHRLAL